METKQIEYGGWMPLWNDYGNISSEHVRNLTIRDAMFQLPEGVVFEIRKTKPATPGTVALEGIIAWVAAIDASTEHEDKVKYIKDPDIFEKELFLNGINDGVDKGDYLLIARVRNDKVYIY